MAIVVHCGALFSSGAEQQNCKCLIEYRNCLDAAIDLPANLFFRKANSHLRNGAQKIQAMFCLSMQPNILKEEHETFYDKQTLFKLLQLTENGKKLKSIAV
jgi:type I restriction-modification system DNA methylase subunit